MVSEPVPLVVLIAICGGLSSFSDMLMPANSLVLRPSWAATMRAPLAVSCELPPPTDTKPSHSSSAKRWWASMTL